MDKRGGAKSSHPPAHAARSGLANLGSLLSRKAPRLEREQQQRSASWQHVYRSRSIPLLLLPSLLPADDAPTSTSTTLPPSTTPALAHARSSLLRCPTTPSSPPSSAAPAHPSHCPPSPSTTTPSARRRTSTSSRTSALAHSSGPRPCPCARSCSTLTARASTQSARSSSVLAPAARSSSTRGPRRARVARCGVEVSRAARKAGVRTRAGDERVRCVSEGRSGGRAQSGRCGRGRRPCVSL